MKKQQPDWMTYEIIQCMAQRDHFKSINDMVNYKTYRNRCVSLIDLSPYNQNFDLGKSRQIFHHSLKEHDKISNIAKFRCEML